MGQLPFMQQLEAHGDELEVRERIAKGQYHGEHLGIALEWLRRKEEKRSSSAASKRDAREEETLSIAKEANRIASNALVAARSSSRWAMWAAIIAMIAIVIAAKDQILTFIFGNP